ncbi:hypothetical protein V6N11_051564 [Hibiscus sabdariffa]|uniref:Uncharacterized protein n=1 Tax=Hibiscus sabdariffa TaxID=183260 RepID=A0ABR2U7I2_9ROSI
MFLKSLGLCLNPKSLVGLSLLQLGSSQFLTTILPINSHRELFIAKSLKSWTLEVLACRLEYVKGGVPSSTESRGSQVAVSGTILLVPSVETLWTVERELVSSLETPNVVVQAEPSSSVQPVRVGTVEVPIPDVSNAALGCSNESCTNRPVSPGVSMDQSCRVVPADFLVSSTATPAPCQSAADDSRVATCTRTVMENGSGLNSTSFEPAIELEPASQVTPELDNVADFGVQQLM